MPSEAKLSCLGRNGTAVISALTAGGAMRRRLMDLGFIPGARVTALFRGFSGDPTAYLICGTVIALRRRDADSINIQLAK